MDTWKDWFVGYINIDSGKVGHDIFTAETESDAIFSFNACYRHHRYEILACVEITQKEYYDRIKSIFESKL